MKSVPIDKITSYVEENIDKFHKARIASLRKLKLEQILKRKNPYLFKAKCIPTSESLIRALLDAHLSSNEETKFGDFFEKLAIFISETAFDGKKSSTEGIDLEFQRKGKRYIVSVKSGPNWANSSQIKKMVQNFKTAKRVLRAHNPDFEIIAVNGCCYGKDSNPDKGDYYKYCGQAFWEFISGDSELYIDLIVPIGYKAKEKNKDFLDEYYRIVNLFTSEFNGKFCKDGTINWEALVKFNSAKK